VVRAPRRDSAHPVGTQLGSQSRRALGSARPPDGSWEGAGVPGKRLLGRSGRSWEIPTAPGKEPAFLGNSDGSWEGAGVPGKERAVGTLPAQDSRPRRRCRRRPCRLRPCLLRPCRPQALLQLTLQRVLVLQAQFGAYVGQRSPHAVPRRLGGERQVPPRPVQLVQGPPVTTPRNIYAIILYIYMIYDVLLLRIPIS
jgi:hypothetical protein